MTNLTAQIIDTFIETNANFDICIKVCIEEWEKFNEL